MLCISFGYHLQTEIASKEHDSDDTFQRKITSSKHLHTLVCKQILQIYRKKKLVSFFSHMAA